MEKKTRREVESYMNFIHLQSQMIYANPASNLIVYILNNLLITTTKSQMKVNKSNIVFLPFLTHYDSMCVKHL